MPDDKTFEATERGHSPGPAVSDTVHQGGTHPDHHHAGERDHSPHDGDKGGNLDGEHVNDPAKGVAGLEHDDAKRDEAAERTEAAESIGAEDRAKGRD